MHAKVVLLCGCITTVRIHSNYYQLFRFVSSDTKSANLASEPFKGIQGISFLLRRKVAPEAFNVCLACVKWMFAAVEGSCTNKLIRCLTKHWRRTSSNSRFPTAAENQLFTSCHGVYWDQKCQLGKHNAENDVCNPFYAVSSAMRLINDTRERCNQKTTYIKSCVWDHAHDVMRREAKQCFTVDILLHDSIWLQTIL